MNAVLGVFTLHEYCTLSFQAEVWAHEDNVNAQTSVAGVKSNQQDKLAIALQGDLHQAVMRLQVMEEEWESLEAQLKEKVESLEVKIGSPSLTIR